VYEALQLNNTLKSLCLRENYLLKSQIPHLAHALQINRTLEELNLEDCDLQQEGVELIVSNMHHFQSLRKLWLRNNVTSQQRDTVDLSDILPSQLEANHVIQLLDFDEEWIPKPELRHTVHNYLLLNRAGRQFLKSSTINDNLPLGMWPILLERVDRCLFRGNEQSDDNFSLITSNDATNQRSKVEKIGGLLCLHSTIFFMLHGPALCQR
jgi:hypothetical protein